MIDVKVGIPREVKNNEFRVAITPAGVHDLVAMAHQLVHAGGGDGHPELVVLDLAGDADLHVDHGPWLRGYGGSY